MSFFDTFFSNNNNNNESNNDDLFNEKDLKLDEEFLQDADNWGGIKIAGSNRW